MDKLTKEDWVEIYYALESKAIAIDHGAYADNKHDKRKWIGHLRSIMEKIGPDGENMTDGSEKLPENVRQYVESGGNICPFCESNELEGGERNTDDGITSQEITCRGCDKRWTDLYRLFNIYVADPGKFPVRLG